MNLAENKILRTNYQFRRFKELETEKTKLKKMYTDASLVQFEQIDALGKKLHPNLFIFLLAISLIFSNCTRGDFDPINDDQDSAQAKTYPSYITSNEDYFETSISTSPSINIEEYSLSISGSIDTSRSYSYTDLLGMDMEDRTLTSECIHNPVNGPLISTAIWKGFKLYDLVSSLGLKPEAKTLKFISADGYYTFISIDVIRSRNVLGALYMNYEVIPLAQGFPIRFITPGYYGLKNPGWVTGIEVIDDTQNDYWADYGWISDVLTEPDCKLFFPKNSTKTELGDTLLIGGAAFGARHIDRVEYTDDYGDTWGVVNILKESEEEHVWVFWRLAYIPLTKGTKKLRFRAIGKEGSIQPEIDNIYIDGTSSQPILNIIVE